MIINRVAVSRIVPLTALILGARYRKAQESSVDYEPLKHPNAEPKERDT
jgi:hypothetical protein